MNADLDKGVREICQAYGNDRGRLMDIARAVQGRFGCVSGEALGRIAAAVGATRVEVESLVSFYAFLSQRPKGKVAIRVSHCVPCVMNGAERVGHGLRRRPGHRGRPDHPRRAGLAGVHRLHRPVRPSWKCQTQILHGRAPQARPQP